MHKDKQGRIMLIVRGALAGAPKHPCDDREVGIDDFAKSLERIIIYY